MTLQQTATVAEAVRTMLAKDVGALLVVDGAGKLVGILSERDLLTKVAGIHTDYTERPISEFMTPKPETLTANKSLAFALHKMDVGGYRHMPLVEDDRPVGMISVRDIMRHITRLCRD